MNSVLRIAQWNANDLSDKRQDIELFIKINKIDVMLISESRFTVKNYFKLKGYACYFTNHPSGNAHDGTGSILIKNTIKHYPIQNHGKDYLQATSIVVERTNGSIIISATYCPPRHTVSKEQLSEYFLNLGSRFIAGGDWNAKYQYWGSRLTLPRGRQLINAIWSNGLQCHSTGKPIFGHIGQPTETKDRIF